jgi:hypothetical protein
MVGGGENARVSERAPAARQAGFSQTTANITLSSSEQLIEDDMSYDLYK